MKKYIARLVKWNGETVEQEIKKEWAESVALAVEGQFTLVNAKEKFSICGGDFKHVNIFEVGE